MATSTSTAHTQSLEERILYLLAPFRPPFVYVQPTNAKASVEDQLAEQRKAKVLARTSSTHTLLFSSLTTSAENIAFLIRNGERGAKVTPDDIFITTWGFQAWAKGSKGGVLALLVREEGKSSKILGVPLLPGDNAIDKMFKEVESELEGAFLGLSKKVNGA